MYKAISKRAKKKFKYIIINVLASSIFIPQLLRRLIYIMMGMTIRTNGISPRCFFVATNIEVGERTFINYNCFFDNSAKITIGKDVFIAPEVSFTTASHEIGEQSRRASKFIGESISIEDGCWIGARAIILPGVTIKKGCIIAAGALVLKDCEPNGVYAGVPAKRIKDLP